MERVIESVATDYTAAFQPFVNIETNEQRVFCYRFLPHFSLPPLHGTRGTRKDHFAAGHGTGLQQWGALSDCISEVPQLSSWQYIHWSVIILAQLENIKTNYLRYITFVFKKEMSSILNFKLTRKYEAIFLPFYWRESYLFWMIQTIFAVFQNIDPDLQYLFFLHGSFRIIGGFYWCLQIKETEHKLYRLI